VQARQQLAWASVWIRKSESSTADPLTFDCFLLAGLIATSYFPQLSSFYLAL
jgi:hypothetical protein